MLPKTAPFIILGLALLLLPVQPGPAAAFDAAPRDPGGRAAVTSSPMQDAPRRLAQKPDYGDIMDDVDAVIDAMDDAVAKPRGRSEGAAPATGLMSIAPTSRSAQPEIAHGPRIPSPIVVELFTAQGCEACPFAEDMLADLKGRPDVLILGWHVDYWDYLGWADDFARPESGDRQKGYNISRGARILFTPQVIVEGEAALDHPNPAALMAAVKRERAEGDHVAISRKLDGARSEIELTPLAALPAEIAVQLIRYLPARSVTVSAGENAGKTLAMHNIVVSSDVLAHWDGKAPLRMTVTLGAGAAADLPKDTRHALIVQHMRQQRPGEIFATILLD